MTVMLNLPPDLEAGLLAHARSEGLDVADYVRNLVCKDLATRSELGQTVQHKKPLSELFAPLRGLDIDFSRNPATGRPVDL
jgi:hypothetical protein